MSSWPPRSSGTLGRSSVELHACTCMHTRWSGRRDSGVGRWAGWWCGAAFVRSGWDGGGMVPRFCQKDPPPFIAKEWDIVGGRAGHTHTRTCRWGQHHTPIRMAARAHTSTRHLRASPPWPCGSGGSLRARWSLATNEGPVRMRGGKARLQHDPKASGNVRHTASYNTREHMSKRELENLRGSTECSRRKQAVDAF